MNHPFYAEALPCESCGEPTFQERQWNPEHELWTATDCSCNTPDQPVCSGLMPIIEACKSVEELLERCKAHRRECLQCGPVEMPRPKLAPRKAA